MDKITVAELATECLVQNQVVFSELKRLGLYVGSATATIDASFADTIRKKILAQRDAEEARALEADKKKEAQAESAKKAEKKGLTKKAGAPSACGTRSRRLKPPARRRSRRKRPRKPSKSRKKNQFSGRRSRLGKDASITTV